MKLKKYDQFLNEELTPMAGEVEMPSEEMPSEEMPSEEMPSDEPEEEYEFQGAKLLEELANRLNSKVENNVINYNDKKIEYFSETGSFAIDRKPQIKKDQNGQTFPLTVDEIISKLEK